MSQPYSSFHRALFEQHPAATLLVDPASLDILDANPAAAAMYGYGREVLCRMTVADLTAAAPGVVRQRLQAARAGTRNPFSVRQRTASGALQDAEIHASTLRTEAGECLCCTVRDVTERVQHVRALEEYRTFFNHLPVAFYRATPGPEGRFLRINPAMARLLGADSPEQLMDRSIASLYVDPADRSSFSDALLERGELFRHEMEMRTLNDRTIWVADTAYLHRDAEGRQVFDGVLEDITRRRELELEMAHQATHDELTGLYNRRWADVLLDQEIHRAERYHTPFAVLMFDLDHFKRVNDTHGHAQGDIVLTRIAQEVLAQVRDTDFVARWGGEEFLVLLPGTDSEGARKLGEKLREAVAAIQLARVGQVTISIGSACHLPGEGPDELLHRLDDALYAAKDGGRNQLVEARRLADSCVNCDR